MAKYCMKFLFFLVGLYPLGVVISQNSFVRTNNIILLNSVGDTLETPWVGGFNSVQFSEIDLDLDGIKDLFVFDRSNSKVSTFINSGIPNQVSYVYAPRYSRSFPKGMKDWVLLRDYNCDGKMDIFTGHFGGVQVFQNTSSSELSFALKTDQIFSDMLPDMTTASYVNIFINGSDIPAIEDVDSDGDLDLLFLSIIGNRIEYHKNLSIEKYGSCDSLDFQLRNRCWGYIKEFPNQNKVTFNDTCSNNINNPEKLNGGDKHLGGSSLFMLDIDSNGTKDLVLGGNSYSNLLLLINSDASPDYTASSISTQKGNFPETYSNTIAVDLEHFPSGYYIDVNNDGVKDLISATNGMSLSENTLNVWCYLNGRHTDRPEFNFLTNSFLQEEMIDVGSGSHPVFFDYNLDGKKDLLIGNYGEFNSAVTEQYVSSLWLYENIGTLTVPRFELVDSNFVNVSSLNLDLPLNRKTFGLAPTFGDVDGDGDEDMILGDYLGYLHYFENIAGAGNVANFVLSQAQYLNIDVGNNAAPQLVDLNRDGLLDMVVGREDGYFSYFENTGSTSLPVFNLITNTLGEANTKRYTDFRGNSVPMIYDDAGSYKMLAGAENGFIYKFGDIEGNLTGTFSVDSSFQNIFEGTSSSVGMADINNDNMLDVVIGNISGGVSVFMGDTAIFVQVKEKESVLTEIRIYPNPTESVLNIDLGDNKLSGASIRLIDVLGKPVFKQTVLNNKLAIDISNYPSGIYFLVYLNPDGKFVSKVVKKD
tara:strand:- start:3615 stop:5885 length:2271 start_codon:yes stop_codon:yes gene_type:complete